MGGPVQNSTFSVVVGSTASTIIVWALNKYLHADIDDTVSMAIVGLVSALLAHFVPDTQPATQAKAPTP